MESELFAQQVREILDNGGGEMLADRRILPLITLDSGSRYGIDATLRWVVVPGKGGPPAVYAPETAHLFHEAVEWKRARFDGTIEQAARGFGLPSSDVVFSFPSVSIARAILAKRMSYLTRLTLAWIHPTEIRQLRPDILAVTRDHMMPTTIKDLAERLIVPE